MVFFSTHFTIYLYYCNLQFLISFSTLINKPNLKLLFFFAFNGATTFVLFRSLIPYYKDKRIINNKLMTHFECNSGISIFKFEMAPVIMVWTQYDQLFYAAIIRNTICMIFFIGQWTWKKKYRAVILSFLTSKNMQLKKPRWWSIQREI